jgi:hypothetical protein
MNLTIERPGAALRFPDDDHPPHRVRRPRHSVPRPTRRPAYRPPAASRAMTQRQRLQLLHADLS